MFFIPSNCERRDLTLTGNVLVVKYVEKMSCSKKKMSCGKKVRLSQACKTNSYMGETLCDQKIRNFQNK